jgi:hypothetical protein
MAVEYFAKIVHTAWARAISRLLSRCCNRYRQNMNHSQNDPHITVSAKITATTIPIIAPSLNLELWLFVDSDGAAEGFERATLSAQATLSNDVAPFSAAKP